MRGGNQRSVRPTDRPTEDRALKRQQRPSSSFQQRPSSSVSPLLTDNLTGVFGTKVYRGRKQTRERYREGERDRETNRQPDRQRQKQRQREKEGERDRGRERERGRGRGYSVILCTGGVASVESVLSESMVGHWTITAVH